MSETKEWIYNEEDGGRGEKVGVKQVDGAYIQKESVFATTWLELGPPYRYMLVELQEEQTEQDVLKR